MGSYENNEPRSIVIIDNASTHFGQRVGDTIRAKGAYLLYTALYWPDLNPIELGFNIYKNLLKRNMELGNVDWFEAHLNSISVINQDTCIKEYRKCGVPFSETILTTEEKETEEENELLDMAMALALL